MVVRFWSAHATSVHFPDYLRHFNTHVLPRLRTVDGFLEARILSQNDGVVARFIVETLWNSMEAVQSFAGPNYDEAVIADEALDLLTSYDRHVQHYDAMICQERRSTSGST
jgi:heme-degrading monooxygenase HmoA